MTSTQTTRSSSLELLEALYPPPVRVSTVNDSPDSPEREHRRQIEYTAFPSVEHARILVSSGAHHASARAIERQLTGQRSRTRIARRLVSSAARYGVLDRVPGSRVTVTDVGDVETIEQRLARGLGAPSVHLTIPVGPPRANRKPILQVSDLAGEPLAFVKVGHNPLTHALVDAEGRSLRAIAGDASNQIEAPRVRAEFEWYGSRVLVMSVLQIPTRRLSGNDARDRLKRLAAQITSLDGPVHRVPWRLHPLRGRLRHAFDDLGDQGRPFLAELEGHGDDVVLGVGAWHGDFNPGNFALVSGACPVWDWERFEANVPPGFDLLHHDLHRWITIERVQPELAATRLLSRSADLLAGVVSPADSLMTAQLYLLTLAERYLRDNQERAGASLGRVTDWLLPALRSYGAGRGE